MRHYLAPLLLLVAAAPLAAEEPGRGVARVSLINGDVTQRRGDSGDWIAAAVNAPLVTGDRVATGRASRAEVQFDYSNFLRLAENTEVRLADIEGGDYQLQVSRGLVTYRILRDRTAEVEINTPTVAVRPVKRGIYRIQVQENGETEITVRDGKAEISSSQGTETLGEGRTMMVRLGLTDRSVEAQELRAAARDDWDDWNERRDRQLQRSRSYEYVHNSVYGVDDLDDHGYWHNVHDYGWCWFPRVSFGWSPYSYGRWVWVDWYGWTWLGYEPWGWAPYHYGRWFRHSAYGWGWYPGYRRHYYWSPALVGFFGWGRHSGFGVGFGFGYGNIGWVPLYPGERYYPWYGRNYYGRGRNIYIDNSVNITNITNIRNVYRNSGADGGIISVNADDFARGRLVNPRRVNVAEVRNAGQIRGLIPVVPDRESLRVTDRDPSSAAIPRGESRDSRFFNRREPTNVERVPFAERQQQLARSIRGDTATVGGRRAESAPAAASEPAKGSIRSLGESNRGWRRVGEERSERPAASGVTSAPQSGERSVERNSGWRRFGEERRPAGPGVTVTPQASERVQERSIRDRRSGEERRGPEASPAPQSTDRRGDGNSSWRRLGERKEAAPERPAVNEPAPRIERQAERDTSWRRFGQTEGGSPSRAPRSDDPGGDQRSMRNWGEPRERVIVPRQESPRLERRSEPQVERRESGSDRSIRGSGGFGEMQRRSEPRGGEGRMEGARPRLEIQRPIMTPRSEGSRGGPRTSEGPRGGGDGSPRTGGEGRVQRQSGGEGGRRR